MSSLKLALLLGLAQLMILLGLLAPLLLRAPAGAPTNTVERASASERSYITVPAGKRG